MNNIENKAEELAGKGKEALGDAVDNDELKREGQADQLKSEIKQAGEKVANAAEKAADTIQDVFKKKTNQS